MGDLDGIESDSDYRELPFDSKDDMMTFNMVDEDDNIMESHEIPVYAYNRVMRKAKEAGVPFLSYVSHIARKKLIGSRLDVVLTGEYEQMLEDTLVDMKYPGWKIPEGMTIEGNPPPEVIAETIVKHKLHMRTHHN